LPLLQGQVIYLSLHIFYHSMHRRLFHLARDTRFALILTILSGFLTGLLAIWQAWILSNIVNDVFLENQTLAQTWELMRIMLFVIAGRALLTWLNEVWANTVAVEVKADLRERLVTHIQKLGPAYTRAERTGELTTAAIEGVEALDAYFSQYLPQLVITALVPISILIFVFPFDLLSGIVLLITGPMIPFFMILIGKGAEAVTKRQYETLNRLSAHFLDSLQGLTTLKIFGQSQSHAKNIEKVSEQFRDTTMQVLRITFLSALALELLTTLSTAVIAVEIGLRLLYARMDFLQAMFILVLAPEFYLPLRILGLRFHAGMDGTAAARRIYEILDLPIENQELRAGTIEINSHLTDIEIVDLSFTYPNNSTATLENINLQIKAGQHIALVGPSGAGKSTLVNLLLGFIQPSKGELIKPPAEFFAWVPQKPHLFHDTIAANIRLGKPETTQEQLETAAKAAYLHDFITSLPDGYQTNIGEHGARLSGGQSQRLALARAFLKDAPILILDESTSNLDPEIEVILEESIHKLMNKKTVITIAHRLNTIFQADQIIVLDKGRVVEQGKHKELMAINGVYAGMVNTLQSEVTKMKAPPEKATPKHKELWNFTEEPSFPMQDQYSKPQSNTLMGLLSFLNGSWCWVALSVLLGVLTIGSNISLMGTSAWLISAASLHPSIAELQVAIVGVRFFGISRAVFRYSERLVSHNVTFRLLARLRVWFYQKLEPLSPARLMDYRAGDLLSRIVGDVEILENLYVRIISPPLVGLVIGLGTSLFLASFYPLLAPVLIGFFLAIGFILPLSSLVLGRKPGKVLVLSRSTLNAHLVDGIQGLPDVLVYGRAVDYAARIANTGKDYGMAQKHMARINGFHNGLTVYMTNFCLWLMIYLTTPLVISGHLDGRMLAPLALLTLASFEAVTSLPFAAQLWESMREASRRLFEVVNAEPVVKDAVETIGESIQVTNLDIEVEKLYFSYPTQAIPAIQDISFKLESGKSLAIVGQSGSGKSTLVNLLLRFWEYRSGDIRLGGRSLHILEQDDVRRRYAVVPQSSYLFNTSIYENLRIARPSTSQHEIETAAQQAEIHKFILSLPNGYDTVVGELGQRLSGGERQRLAIARALLKNAPILILDEPTANLDPPTEKQILETLFRVMQEKTALLITHRLVGLENIDEILVLKQGRIVERGTQDELLIHYGPFRRLLELQNRILTR
jgi:ATP-binding cassette subfamily C protein CydCD